MSSPPRAKRPRIPKDFRACRSCVTSKVRCEDFIPAQGCRRCRRRDERCSFIDEPPSVLPSLASVSEQAQARGYRHGHGHGQSEGSPSSAEGQATRRGGQREGYARLEERVKDLEARLHARHSNHKHQSRANGHGQGHAYASPDSAYPTPTPPSASHGSTPLAHPTTAAATTAATAANAAAAGDQRRRKRHEIQLSSIFLRRADERKLRWQHRFDETAYALVDPAGFPDVVEEGVVSPEQMDMYYHAFKARMSQILPLPLFTRPEPPTAPAPTHPFLRLAILVHTRPLHQLHLADLVEDSLVHVIRGAVGPDVLLGLLVLSLAPANAFTSYAASASSPQFSALRLVSLAYTIGQDLGFETRAERQARVGVMNPDQLEQALLWEAIKVRYNILRTVFTANTSRLPSSLPYVPDSPEMHNPAVLRSFEALQAQNALLDYSSELVYTISSAEDTVSRGLLVDMASLTQVWESFLNKLDTLRAVLAEDHLLTMYETYSLMYGLGIRIVSVALSVPTPYHPRLRVPGYKFLMKDFTSTARTVIRSFVDTPPAHLSLVPASILNLVLMATMTAHRVANEVGRVRGAVPPQMVRMPAVIAAERRMLDLVGGEFGEVVRRVQAAYGELDVAAQAAEWFPAEIPAGPEMQMHMHDDALQQGSVAGAYVLPPHGVGNGWGLALGMSTGVEIGPEGPTGLGALSASVGGGAGPAAAGDWATQWDGLILDGMLDLDIDWDQLISGGWMQA